MLQMPESTNCAFSNVVRIGDFGTFSLATNFDPKCVLSNQSSRFPIQGVFSLVNDLWLSSEMIKNLVWHLMSWNERVSCELILYGPTEKEYHLSVSCMLAAKDLFFSSFLSLELKEVIYRNTARRHQLSREPVEKVYI